MSPGKLSLAVAAVLAAGGARPVGAQPQVAPANTGTGAQVAATPPANQPAPAAEPPRRLLMRGLDAIGVGGPLDDARVRFFGYVQGSYTYNPDPTHSADFGDLNLDRLFDFKPNTVLLNQLNLAAERTVDPSEGKWDVGFRAEMVYGSDARFMHANGLNFYGTGEIFNQTIVFQDHPNNQWDLFQAYVDVGVPVGNGLTLRLGKFEGFFGGTVDPNRNAFYSRSLVFASTHPITFTGVLASYPVDDRLVLEVGFSRGWEQALEDNNDSLDFLTRINYTLSDRTRLAVALVTGPESDNDNSNFRTLVEATVKHRVTESLGLAATATYGQEAVFHKEVAQDANGDPIFELEPDARWYGAAGYLSLRLNRQFTFNTRLEFLRDEKGFATAQAGNTYSGTAGLTIVPFPDDEIGRNFKIRPEVRLDYSGDERYGGSFENGFTRQSQFTFAIDAIFNF